MEKSYYCCQEGAFLDTVRRQESLTEQSAVQTLLLLTFYLKRKPGKPAHYKNDSDQMQRTHPARGTGCEELIYKEDGLGSLLPHPRIFDSDCLNRLFLFFFFKKKVTYHATPKRAQLCTGVLHRFMHRVATINEYSDNGYSF